jgi:hypothetical protein
VEDDEVGGTGPAAFRRNRFFGALIEEVRFAVDSPLEEAVSSEPVSEAKFPASWENTVNFVRLGLRVRLLARNQ